MRVNSAPLSVLDFLRSIFSINAESSDTIAAPTVAINRTIATEGLIAPHPIAKSTSPANNKKIRLTGCISTTSNTARLFPLGGQVAYQVQSGRFLERVGHDAR